MSGWNKPLAHKSSNYGDSALLAVPSSARPDARPPGEPVRLVDVRDDRIGSWVVAISCDIDNVGAFSVPVIRARIGMGSGGVVHVVEVDCFPGLVVTLPVQSVTVDVFVDPDQASAENVVARVRGTAQRTWGETRATLTRFAGIGVAAPQYQVPPFATRWFPVGQRTNQGPFRASTVWQELSGGGLQLKTLNGSDVRANVLAGTSQQLTPFAQFVVATYGGGDVTDASDGCSFLLDF